MEQRPSRELWATPFTDDLHGFDIKGTGMRWERIHVNPMLALRNAVCNERWLETWQTASQQRRDLLAQHRHQRTVQRPQARQEALKQNPALVSPSALPPAPLLPPDPPVMLPGTSRPSEHHPWKRGPTLCSPAVCKKVSRTHAWLGLFIAPATAPPAQTRASLHP
jgi:hypothetical protein